MERPSWMRWSVDLVAEQEQAHPGFASALRLAALRGLTSEDDRLTRRALAALAVVGQRMDVESINASVANRGSAVQADARTAIFEIEHRAPAV